MRYVLLLAIAIHALGFAVFHLLFYHLFEWNRELNRLSPVNRAIVLTLNACLTGVFFMMAGVMFYYREIVAETEVLMPMMIGVSGFWWFRLGCQVFFKKIRHPLIHLLSVIFLLGAIMPLLVMLI